MHLYLSNSGVKIVFFDLPGAFVDDVSVPGHGDVLFGDDARLDAERRLEFDRRLEDAGADQQLVQQVARRRHTCTHNYTLYSRRLRSNRVN